MGTFYQKKHIRFRFRFSLQPIESVTTWMMGLSPGGQLEPDLASLAPGPAADPGTAGGEGSGNRGS